MSKNPKPTAEELRCIYGLILRGYEDADILAEYAELYENGNLMFPCRTDKRFVRERRKELAAAEAVLQGHVKKKVDPVISKRKEEYYNRSADIAQLLLGGGLDKVTDAENADEYQIMHEDYVAENIAHDQLIDILESNVDVACQRYSQGEVFACLMSHVEA